MNSKTLFFIFLLNVTLITGCTSYRIPMNSFKSQFFFVDSTKLIQVKVFGPIGEQYEYLANPIEEIKCIDKYGNNHIIKNSPSIETRITRVEGKRIRFYFDSLYIHNDTLIGYRSRFIGMPKSIPMDSITMIEVQDGKKNFHYINKN